MTETASSPDALPDTDGNAPPFRFVHLRCHSEYSITDGILRLDEAVGRAVADGMPALAITDLMNLFALVKFYKGAQGKGLKPIVGVDCWITNPNNPDHPGRLLLLVRNRKGYRQLCELLTRAHTDPERLEKAQTRPQIARKWFAEIGSDGLIALSGGAIGDIGEAILARHPQEAKKRAQVWRDLFPGAFYLEVQRPGLPEDERLIHATVNLAVELELPVVATHPVQFSKPEDFRAHEARVCIAEGYTLGDTRRPRLFTDSQYFKTQEEMVALFDDLPEALENTLEIAKRCNLELTLGENFLPHFSTPEGVSLEDYLTRQAEEGLERRLAEIFPDPEVRASRRPEYDERLQTELATIIQMGFSGYFLIVADFINWSKQNGVPVGPGRGSGAGSLVAFSLGITDLDPIPYALLFERFLNPERVSMPDFDIDFCQDNRYRTIEYVREHYGQDAVSQIVTFGTLSSRAVVRDVGRVLDLPFSLCDRISKLIPVKENKPVPLAVALETEPLLREMMAGEDKEALEELFGLAMRLEDLTRNVGMHAGGVLIAPGRIVDFCPTYQAAGNDASPVSQFDKDDVEKIGLVKFDFLGLKNLTIIELALNYIERMTGERPDLMKPGFSDPEVYKILREANTTAIFQVESEGMKKLLKKLGPDCFEDIIAVLALYRPGPLGSGMVDDFCLRKKGKQRIDYFHPALEACLAPTYGVIVYQEQVMQISQIIGGYTLGGADLLRRAMGKKKPEEMARHRGTIAEGAKRKGFPPALAEHLFDLMAQFAEYGFNKSHSAAYAVLTYQTAWLKAYHPAAFMAATLSSDMNNTDTIKVFYDDCLKNRIRVLGPDINTSAYRFEPVDKNTIRYGLGAIKGTGEQAIRVIGKAREEGGEFRDLFDFCRRVDKRQVNRGTIEALIRAGAFDSIDPERHKLLASTGIALEAAEQAEKNALQASLFDAFGSDEKQMLAPQYIAASPWNERERLTQEKQALGFFLSGHLYDSVRQELSRFIPRELARIAPGREAALVAGVVSGQRAQITRRGKMLFVQLDDGTAQAEASVFNELFKKEGHKIKSDEVLIVEGKISSDEYNGSCRIVADRLMTLGELRARFASGLRLTLDGKTSLAQLKDILAPFPGSSPVSVKYRNDKASCEFTLGSDYHVTPENALLEELATLAGAGNVEVRYG
ncbi:MAG: DNA polymerase III subunit alpha [Zoogloeaceae bacterium]|jgi:DNA polymerase-3 subunit alpha|nr:DNA polymerase III subunit alpha [Zoogloeaceae bacterium]